MDVLYLNEAAFPQPGVYVEDSLISEAVERTLEQNAACWPQEAILKDRTTAQLSKVNFQMNRRATKSPLFKCAFVFYNFLGALAINESNWPYFHVCCCLSYQFEWLASLWSCHSWSGSPHAAFCHHLIFLLWIRTAISAHLLRSKAKYSVKLERVQLFCVIDHSVNKEKMSTQKILWITILKMHLNMPLLATGIMSTWLMSVVRNQLLFLPSDQQVVNCLHVRCSLASKDSRILSECSESLGGRQRSCFQDRGATFRSPAHWATRC